MISKRTKRRRVKEEVDCLLNCNSNATDIPFEKKSSNIDLSPNLNDSILYSDLFFNEHYNSGNSKNSLEVSKIKNLIF